MINNRVNLYNADSTNTLSLSLNSDPVFVHSGFRTSSTWLWSKMRAVPTTTAYCEVFHEILQDATYALLREVKSTAWDSGHPSCAPYFLEFLPLLEPSGGILGYNSQMAFETFIPAGGVDGNLSAAEILYVDKLILSARSRETIPVLCDTRTLGRARALNRHYAGINVLLYRNIFHQWASFSSHLMAGNGYFFSAINTILNNSLHDPFFKMLNEWFSDRETKPTSARLFLAFALFHMYLYAVNADIADIFVDVNAITVDLEKRRAVEDALSAALSARIDLSDIHLKFGCSVVKIDDSAIFYDELEQFTKIINSFAPTPKSTLLVRKMKDDLLLELDRHNFYAEKLASFYVENNNALRGKGEEVETLSSQLAAAQSAQIDLERKLSHLSDERDAILAQVTVASGMQAELQTALSDSNAVQQGMASQLTQIERSLLESEASLLEVSKEKDYLASALEVTSASLKDAQNSLSLARKEHDSLSDALAEANLNQSVLRSEIVQLTEERDNAFHNLNNSAENNAELQRKIDEANAKVVRLELQLAEMLESKLHLEKTIDILVKKQAADETVHEEAIKILNDLQERIERVTTERSDLATELASNRGTASAMQATIERVSNERNQLIERNTELTIAQSELEHKIAQLCEQLDQLKAQLRNASAPIFLDRFFGRR